MKSTDWGPEGTTTVLNRLAMSMWPKAHPLNENRNLTPLPLYSMTFLSIFVIHLICRFPFTPMWAPDDNFYSKETLPFPAASQPSFFFAIYTTYRYLFVFQHTVEPPYNGHLGDRRKWPLYRGLKKSQCTDFSSAGTKKSGRCREVTVSGGWTVLVTGFPGVVILSFNRIIGGKVFIKEVSFTACHSGKL